MGYSTPSKSGGLGFQVYSFYHRPKNGWPKGSGDVVGRFCELLDSYPNDIPFIKSPDLLNVNELPFWMSCLLSHMSSQGWGGLGLRAFGFARG